MPPAWLSEQSFTLQAGADGFRQVMRGKRRPTAIFCGNDLLATGALFEAQRMGLSVPQDVSIMGVDNQEIAQAIVPTLTTIALAMQDMGVLSAQHTIQAIHGRPVPSQSLLAHELIERESTAPV